ncbi:copper transporter 6-like [Zingiber officinale]|uniref:Copper transport protein n=1 Tax=Zingiber officinale TaxID=94328 RepID=A0A8J5KEE1_ZINOF|nr:copper transporter 6-like [Zingiber officinale]KAG6478842.1 hypothetical protein ZIOFF_062287 [Zingiber officinale]
MDHGGGGMGGGGMTMNSTTTHYTAMTFFWGKNSEILFAGWPGTHGGMYALALITVFLLGLLVEWLDTLRLFHPPPAGKVCGGGGGGVTAGLGHTILHALRVGTAYLLMLAVMSFNGGVFIVAVTGRALGFLLFTRPALLKEATDCCP